jgi:hypothetical protein
MARDAQPNSGRKRPPEMDWTAGMPLGHENPYSPTGEIEQFTKFASGVKRATGWRRIVGRLLALVILLPIIAAIILSIAHYV